MNKQFVALLFLVLAGCAAPGPRMGLEKAGATQQDLAVDVYECLQRSQVSVAGSYANSAAATSGARTGCDYQLFHACMMAKAYTLVPNGRFRPVVQCIQ